MRPFATPRAFIPSVPLSLRSNAGLASYPAFSIGLLCSHGWLSLDAGALREGCDELGGVPGEPGKQASLGTISGNAEPASEQGKILLQSLPALFL